MVSNTAQLKISVVSGGLTRTYFCSLTKVLAPAETTTGGGDTGSISASQTSGFGALSSPYTTYTVISDTLTFKTSASQTSATATINMFGRFGTSANQQGPWNIGYKLQRNISGTWTDRPNSTPQNSNPDPYIDEDPETGRIITHSGSMSATITDTGLSSSTSYSYRLVAAITSGTVPTNGVIMTFTGSISIS
jgi:hypothetical protein